IWDSNPHALRCQNLNWVNVHYFQFVSIDFSQDIRRTIHESAKPNKLTVKQRKTAGEAATSTDGNSKVVLPTMYRAEPSSASFGRAT
ncbi:hypothetical protein LZ189_20060, partial [Rhodovulum sulfidophilum]|nr:hypothetical protein [Rhodovulum sulfidophilum]